MVVISEQLKNIEIRNQVFLEGLKEGEHRKFSRFLKNLSIQIIKRLKSEGQTIETKRRLRILLADFNEIQNSIYSEYIGFLGENLEEITIDQSEFEAQALNRTVKNFDAVIPAPVQLLTAARVVPMSVQGLSSEPLLKPFIKGWTESSINRVNTVVQQGFAQGKTVQQMSLEIRGTKQQKFKNGVLAKINRDNRTIIRTSVQHVASVARTETMRQNSDVVKGYQVVATLDSKTSATCRGLDGREFKIGQGPLPPFHPNCRTTTTAVLDERFDFLDQGAKRPAVGEKKIGQISANTTYYEWLKTQSAVFQDSVLGVTRGKLFRNGGLDAEKFARWSLNNKFQPLTLFRMKALRPEVFEKANVDV